MIPVEAVDAVRAIILPYVDDEHFDLSAVARAALEAAAPHMLAGVLRDAADEFHARLPDGTGNGRAYNSHQVASILRERANELEPTP